MVSGGPRMVTHPKARFLAEDIWDSPDDGNRYEVIDGELYVSPPPNREHQHASGQLQGTIWSYLQTNPIGTLYSAPFGVLLGGAGGRGGVQPDLVYILNERQEILTDQGADGAPDLVVEILSPSTRTRDRGIKLRQYEAAGVRYYWIADPRTHTLEERVLGDDGYGPPTVYGIDDTFRPA